jgi:serine/threonine protein phosphatase PrpC
MKQFLTAQAFAIDEWLLKSQKDNAVDAGSTASLGFYDPTSNLFYVFNVGDSRTVWFQTTTTGGAVKKGTWHQSQDHKPSLASEIDRIERAGGTVRTSGKSKSSVARVDGVLALSRSFGDFSLKEELVTHRGGTGDWVTVKPKIVGPYRVPASGAKSGAGGEFYAVSGSDGVWDCMSSKEITRLIVASSDALKIQCRDLVQENIDRWAEGRGADNVTLTIMRIGSAKK